MNISIHNVVTAKLPAPASIHDEPTAKRLRMPKQSVAGPWAGRYDENRLLRSVKVGYKQGFTWLPVAIFVASLMFWSLAAWIIAANFFAIERALTFW